MKIASVSVLGALTATAWFSPSHAAEAQTAGKPPQGRLALTTKKSVGPDGPAYVFKVYALNTISNFRYRVDFSPEGDSKAVQSVEFRNGVPIEDKADSFQIVDVDLDSYQDIKVRGGEVKGKSWFKIFLFNPSKRTFEWKRNS